MEPSRERDGDLPELFADIGEIALQWSRRANATETLLLRSLSPYSLLLQWSRRANATETQPIPYLLGDRLLASMEPSRERDGDEPGPGAPERQKSGFNGAVARTRRRHR